MPNFPLIKEALSFILSVAGAVAGAYRYFQKKISTIHGRITKCHEEHVLKTDCNLVHTNLEKMFGVFRDDIKEQIRYDAEQRKEDMKHQAAMTRQDIQGIHERLDTVAMRRNMDRKG